MPRCTRVPRLRAPAVLRRGSAALVLATGLGLLGAAAPVPRAEAAENPALAAAAAYLDALVSHDPSDVPLHPDAHRTENGVPTGFSGAQIRRDLRDGPQYRVIRRIDDTRYRREGERVTVDYRLVAGLGADLATTRVHEIFTVPGGAIRAITAEITPERVGR